MTLNQPKLTAKVTSLMLFIAVVVLIGALSPVFAKEHKNTRVKIDVYINGSLIQMQNAPAKITTNGEIFLPIRVLSQALSVDVKWHPIESILELNSSRYEIAMMQGSKKVYINGEIKHLESPLDFDTEYGTSYIPISFISTYLNAEVFYVQDVATKAIRLDIDKVPLGPSDPNLVSRGLDRSRSKNLVVSLYEILAPSLPEIDTPISQATSEYISASRTDINAFGDSTMVFPMNNHVRYLSHKNGLVTGWSIFGGNWHSGNLSAGMTWKQVTALYPYLLEQPFKVGTNQCHVKQVASKKGEVLLYISGNNAFEFFFDKQSDRLLGVKYFKANDVVKTCSYSTSWRYVGKVPERHIPKMTQEKKLAIDKSHALQLFEMTNLYRKANKLPNFSRCPVTEKIAASHTLDMAKNKFVSHVSPNSGSLKNRYKHVQPKLTFVSENIAFGSFDSMEALNSWINSPGHRANLLTTSATKIGIGIFDQYYTQNFTNY